MRLGYLDGMRGIFSLSVVVFHVFFIFLPSAVTGDPGTMHLSGGAEHILSRLPQFLYNGNCGVCVFFVLSGFVLSCRFWEKREQSLLTSAALRRYVRLTPPALASILLAWLFLSMGWMRTQEIFQVARSIPLVGELYRFLPDLAAAWKEGCWDIYFAYNQPNSYNPVLWTMEVELKGSFLSFAFLSLMGRLRMRWVFYVVLAVLFWRTYYLSFVLGVALSDLSCSAEGREIWRALEKRQAFAWIALVLGILFSSYIADDRHRIFSWMNVSFWGTAQVNSEVLYHILGAALLVYAVLQVRLLQRLLGAKYLVLLGRYSFALYLVHVPVLCSLGGILFLHFLHRGCDYGNSLAVAVAACIPVIAILSIGMYHLVDVPANALARRLERSFMG